MAPVATYQVFVKQANFTGDKLREFGWWLFEHLKSPYNVVTGFGEPLNLLQDGYPIKEPAYTVWSFTSRDEARLFQETWGGQFNA